MTDQYLARLNTGDSVLDIGCGNGKLITGLPDGVSYLGTDFSQTLLAEAARLHPQHEFRYGDVLSQSDWDTLGEYDAIFCVAVLHHIPERDQQLYVLRQIKQHLAKDGSLYLTVWNLNQPQFVQYQVGDHYEIPYNKQWRRYCVLFDIETLTSVVTKAGLEVVEIYYADREGMRVDIQSGQNLVVVAR